MFCSKCGARVSATVPAPEFPIDSPPAASSMPLALEDARAVPNGESKAPAPRAIAAKTMIGVAMPSLEGGTVPREVVGAGRPEEPGAELMTPPDVGEFAPAPPARPAGSPGMRTPGAARTMLGMPAPDAVKVQEAVERARAEAAAQRAQAPVVAPSSMLGEQMPPGTAPEGSVPSENVPSANLGHPERTFQPSPTLERGGPIDPPPKKSPAAALDPNTNRTMLGQPVPRMSVGAAPAFEAGHPGAHRAGTATAGPGASFEEELLPLPTRVPRTGLALLALGFVVLAAGGGALAWALLSGSSALRASVVQGEDGEMLAIEVPGAADGTRLRFHGTEQLLEAGSARFRLSPDELTLGNNELIVDVVSPEGTVESHAVALHLEMRVRADLGPLTSAPPAIDVVVEAPAGSEATLDGEALALDERGRGTRRFPIEGAQANAEGVIEHLVRYRVTPPEGETAQGELRTRIPLTTMQLDRPGQDVVTDRETVEVAGAVAPEAVVTVDGDPVEVRMGHFLHRLHLPDIGERTVEVVATVRGKAPRVERIRIRRVRDLEAEASDFEVNRELTYAHLTQNPNTYRGQQVAFEGVVYNVDVRQGRSILQVLVGDCPDGQRCPLWVTYPAATEAELQSRVRVLGTVAGEQQFRSQNGEIRTVPRVDATFVLPAR